MTPVDVILALIIVLCAVLLVWPFLIYPLILRMLPTKPVQQAGVAAPPTVSLLFCAYNEAASLPTKIENLRALKARHPASQILAFDDGSSDGTGDLLAQAQGVLTLLRGPGRSGKAHGMKQLAAMATGDILVFTDANVLLDADAIDALLPYYADPQVGGVLGSLHYDGADRSASASVGALYWRLEEHLKDIESRTGNVMGADGSIFSMRRALYPDFPDSVLDDLTVSMAVVFAGRRLIKAKDVIAREAMVAQRADEYRRKVRIAARSWHTHRHLRARLRRMSRLDRFKYGSRKIVRWFGGLWIGLAVLAALALAWRITPVAAVALVAAGLVLAMLGAMARRGPLAAIFDLLLAYMATLKGVMLAMRGQTFTLWTPAKSRD
ncbi:MULTISPECIES: glycosyltransferase [unclassified Sphingobium]|uniref:glycosyltransferase n=1 Tax=unclassified Sphingobium TaxID=2611147 RepID=UPI0022244F81|nr:MULTISPECIES: glycosyltransferase [unclassified Sphingobium]MCW2394947.1 cellulose synthase/poly-beta-1,6-N-acetylglucosamine synthase-like glycosyltransferase [Sphingobium sp. B8D3B]MCW2418461.1 cellulose synthase/poly-beta-1,6-N-acetylglucosamine synthase-like glycosyltransferase [Sphingobium sp. B8D3C]